MVRINKFNAFNNTFLNESVSSRDDIREMIDDYFLEYVDSGSKSNINIYGYTDGNKIKYNADINNSIVYSYNIELSSYVELNRLQLIESRIRKDNNFKIIKYNYLSNISSNDGDITGQSKIFIYFTTNNVVQKSELISRVLEKLSKFGYKYSHTQEYDHMFDKKSPEYKISNQADIDIFSKTGRNNLERLLQLKDIKDAINKDIDMISNLLPEIKSPSYKHDISKDNILDGLKLVFSIDIENTDIHFIVDIQFDAEVLKRKGNITINDVYFNVFFKLHISEESELAYETDEDEEDQNRPHRDYEDKEAEDLPDDRDEEEDEDE